ncbi:hypothetical protein ET33_09365 [Paenibacillus tyrfis]|uniref:Uncharacterized protein n=1 Tax=Paenibacillus tyrfis TaxID=1501230 RepID=A0A081P1A3_9BACL|nr:hypothetical protein ET33_09365 [Paenibacillus tyrfis]
MPTRVHSIERRTVNKLPGLTVFSVCACASCPHLCMHMTVSPGLRFFCCHETEEGHNANRKSNGFTQGMGTQLMAEPEPELEADRQQLIADIKRLRALLMSLKQS